MKKIAYNAPEMEELDLKLNYNVLMATSGGDPNISNDEPNPDDVDTD